MRHQRLYRFHSKQPQRRSDGVFEKPARKPKKRSGSVNAKRKRTKAANGHKTPRTPRTPVPQTPTAREANYVVSLIEYRNRLEVGLAVMNTRATELILYQFSDKNSCYKTVSLLEQYEPTEILFPDTAENTNMYKVIKRHFQLCQCKLIQRKYFNEAQGATVLHRQCTQESLANIKLDSSLYLCLAAAAACIKYMQFSMNINFAPRSLRISLKNLAGCMRIDSGTIKNLELVANLKDPKSKQGTLFGMLNICKTPMGTRLLRSSLFQPLSDADTLNIRLDAVEQLLQREDVFYGLCALLPSLMDLDHLNAQLVQIPKHPTDHSKQATIMNILQLKQTLKILPEIRKSLLVCEGTLLEHICGILGKKDIKEITDVIDEVLQPDAANATSKTIPSVLHSIIAFAIKPGVSPMLDVARATYTQVIEEIHHEVEQYKVATNNEYNLKLVFKLGRGYHLSVPRIGIPRLPDVFIQRVASGKRVFCTTDNLISLDDRRRETFAEIIGLTDRALENLLADIRKHIHWLQVAAEAVAYLDMILAFSNVVTQRSNFTRPHFSADGPLAIRNGRHPVVEMISTEEYVPNDTFMTENANFHIITGPNASGKSTYLRQVCVMVVIAHIGCFVPATYASFRVVDQMFTRLSNSDDLEENQSTFFTEAKETAYILNNISSRSFIAIDELGRGTSSIDGVAIAWAVAENLMQKQCYSLFTTHFFELTALADMYPRVKHKCLQVAAMESGSIDFLFKIADSNGSNKNEKNIEQYGIYIAEAAGFPHSAIQFAKKVAKELKQKIRDSTSGRKSLADDVSIYSLVDRLYGVKHATLPKDGIKRYLVNLKHKYLPLLTRYIESPSQSRDNQNPANNKQPEQESEKSSEVENKEQQQDPRKSSDIDQNMMNGNPKEQMQQDEQSGDFGDVNDQAEELAENDIVIE